MDEHLAARVLSELEGALSKIEEQAGAASAAFLASGSDLAAMQLAEAASDVVAAGRRIVAAQSQAMTSIAHVAAQFEALSPRAEWIMTSETEELEELRIIWKSWFFFVRALCDHVYRLLLASAEGRAAGRGGTMGAVRNERNPVAIVLAEQAPGFIPWFARFRAQRNEVKEGVNFGFTALASPGISATFNVFRFDAATGRRSVLIDSSGDRKVTLLDVLEGARMLAQALSILALHTAKPPSGRDERKS